MTAGMFPTKGKDIGQPSSVSLGPVYDSGRVEEEDRERQNTKIFNLHLGFVGWSLSLGLWPTNQQSNPRLKLKMIFVVFLPLLPCKDYWSEAIRGSGSHARWWRLRAHQTKNQVKERRQQTSVACAPTHRALARHNPPDPESVRRGGLWFVGDSPRVEEERIVRAAVSLTPTNVGRETNPPPGLQAHSIHHTVRP